MTAKQRILVVAVLVVSVIGGGIVAMAVLGGGGSPEPSSAAGTPTAIASAGATPEAPTASPTESPTAVPTPTAEPTPTPSPTPTPPPGPPATIVLTQLKLDAKDDPTGRDRLVTFTTGGTGTVTVTLRTIAPMGSTVMCLSADGTAVGCQTTADGTLTTTTGKAAASFELSLRGSGIEAPIIEVEITFPAATPAVTLANARFDGTMFFETNGIQAIVTPRGDGNVRLTADWGGHPFLYEVDLFEQGGSGSQTLANQGPATRMDQQFLITAGNPWKVVLQNTELGFGPTPMTVTIAWRP